MLRLGRRMSHSVKRAKPKNEQFRMAVPPDIRPLVGKIEWRATLGTIERVATAAKRGELIAFYKNEVLRLHEQLAHKPVEVALALLDRGFERLAVVRGSMDKAISEQLALLASTVIGSWSAADQLGPPQDWNGITIWEAPGDLEPVPSLDTESEREIFRLRVALLEVTGRTDGILYRRLAALLLERRVFMATRFAVSYMTSIDPKLTLDRDNVYEAVATAYLKRLAGHCFTNWPANAEAAIEAILSIPGAAAPAHVNLPQGHDTLVGFDGAQQSAGRRQRIGLARAVDREPFFVPLDESISNLDAAGEAALQRRSRRFDSAAASPSSSLTAPRHCRRSAMLPSCVMEESRRSRRATKFSARSMHPMVQLSHWVRA